jgi:hypothetical protein
LHNPLNTPSKFVLVASGAERKRCLSILRTAINRLPVSTARSVGFPAVTFYHFTSFSVVLATFQSQLLGRQFGRIQLKEQGKTSALKIFSKSLWGTVPAHRFERE